MSRRQHLLGLAAALPVLIAAGSAAAQQSGADPALLERGKELYQRECAACHGAEGDGEGPGAYILSQRPRNLQLGVFKLRSTPTGQNPTDEDLFQSITRGIAGPHGAMMPSFASLPEADRWALVAVVKDFGLIEAPGEAITVPPRPATADLALGKQVYGRLECASCHGAEGAGDGPSSLTLKDDQKRRIWATDLTDGRFKGGAEPEEIYTRIHTGLSGSPMPAYGNKATAEELWALTEYVLSFSAGTASTAKD